MKLKHFKLYELVDRKTFETEGNAAWNHFTDDILLCLDGLRDFFGRSVTVNNWMAGGQFQFRGYRPPWYDGGATHSQHRRGNAFDCDIMGMPAKQARQEIIDNKDNPLLIAIMRMENNVSWIHADCGPIPEGKARIYLFNP